MQSIGGDAIGIHVWVDLATGVLKVMDDNVGGRTRC